MCHFWHILPVRDTAAVLVFTLISRTGKMCQKWHISHFSSKTHFKVAPKFLADLAQLSHTSARRNLQAMDKNSMPPPGRRDTSRTCVFVQQLISKEFLLECFCLLMYYRSDCVVCRKKKRIPLRNDGEIDTKPTRSPIVIAWAAT